MEREKEEDSQGTQCYHHNLIIYIYIYIYKYKCACVWVCDHICLSTIKRMSKWIYSYNGIIFCVRVITVRKKHTRCHENCFEGLYLFFLRNITKWLMFFCCCFFFWQIAFSRNNSSWNLLSFLNAGNVCVHTVNLSLKLFVEMSN